jgi:hypothetical protein
MRTIINRHTDDHVFHIHTNDILLTKINGDPLAEPIWLGHIDGARAADVLVAPSLTIRAITPRLGRSPASWCKHVASGLARLHVQIVGGLIRLAMAASPSDRASSISPANTAPLPHDEP